MPLPMPPGKFLATVKVGEKGQIVIPKEARDMFNIHPGDALLLLADVDQGIALVQNGPYLNLANHILNSQKGIVEPEEKESEENQ